MFQVFRYVDQQIAKDPNAIWVITDLRFDNELVHLQNLGAKIVKIEIAGDESAISDWLGSEVKAAIGNGIEVEWVSVDTNDGDTGIVAVEIETTFGAIRLD